MPFERPNDPGPKPHTCVLCCWRTGKNYHREWYVPLPWRQKMSVKNNMEASDNNNPSLLIQWAKTAGAGALKTFGTVPWRVFQGCEGKSYGAGGLKKRKQCRNVPLPSASTSFPSYSGRHSGSSSSKCGILYVPVCNAHKWTGISKIKVSEMICSPRPISKKTMSRPDTKG